MPTVLVHLEQLSGDRSISFLVDVPDLAEILVDQKILVFVIFRKLLEVLI